MLQKASSLIIFIPSSLFDKIKKAKVYSVTKTTLVVISIYTIDSVHGIELHCIHKLI